MKRLLLVFALLFSLPVLAQRDRAPVDLVFALDLSGSTNGLVDDVRDNLWDIINQVSSYRPDVNFRIGIVAFSRPSFGRENGYVKILCDLTNSFEIPAYELAKLKPSIEKGDQLVGMALKTSILGLRWSTNENAVKTIFLIGNGNVNLDGTKYRDAYEEAANQKIIINTIYCSSSNYKKEIFGWKEIARQTGGIQYDMRVHHRNAPIVTCKETEKLDELSKRLAGTYFYFGKNGSDIFKMINLIDKTARLSNEQTFQSRLYYKASSLFQGKQEHWDLVDYIMKTNSDFTEIDFSTLPDTLQKYSPAQLRIFVLNKKNERLKLLSELRQLLRFDRQQLINKEVKEKEFDKNPNTLDRIVLSWLNATVSIKGVNAFVN